MSNDIGLAPGSIRHLVWLYAGPDQARLGALFTIEREIMASIRPALDHSVAHARLGWWAEECERLNAALPRHPATVTLLRERRRERSAPPDLLPLVAAARWDLARAVPANEVELAQRCEYWATGLFLCLAPSDLVDIEPRVVEIGRLIEELGLLCALRADAFAGRMRLPLDLLQSLDLPLGAVTMDVYPQTLSDHLATRHHRIRGGLAAALAAIAPTHRPAARGVFVWADLAAAQSGRVERALPGPIANARLQALRNNWTAWRAARRALRATPRGRAS